MPDFKGVDRFIQEDGDINAYGFVNQVGFCVRSWWMMEVEPTEKRVNLRRH